MVEASKMPTPIDETLIERCSADIIALIARSDSTLFERENETALREALLGSPNIRNLCTSKTASIPDLEKHLKQSGSWGSGDFKFDITINALENHIESEHKIKEATEKEEEEDQEEEGEEVAEEEDDQENGAAAKFVNQVRDDFTYIDNMIMHWYKYRIKHEKSHKTSKMDVKDRAFVKSDWEVKISGIERVTDRLARPVVRGALRDVGAAALGGAVGMASFNAGILSIVGGAVLAAGLLVFLEHDALSQPNDEQVSPDVE